MVLDTFFGATALLYYVCFALLAGLAIVVVIEGRQRAHASLRRVFVLLAFSLLIWLATLFLEVRTTLPAAQLWLGRANFTAMVLAAYFALRFVQEVPARRLLQATAWSRILLMETVLLAVLTLLTPLVSVAERVEAGHAITTFGPLFPLYLIHVLGCWLAALVLAIQGEREAKDRVVREQMAWIASGMVVTGGVAAITNAWLPYGYNDFRFSHVGTLSTVVFALAIAYATFFNHLFDLRVVLRKTLVYGILLAFVLGAYGSTAFLLTEYLSGDADRLTRFVVLLIAFSFDPLRRFLEDRTDRLLFGKRDDNGLYRKRTRS